jgi:hypothetical protein
MNSSLLIFRSALVSAISFKPTLINLTGFLPLYITVTLAGSILSAFEFEILMD